MSRPKNIDSIVLALKAKVMEFERENGVMKEHYPPTINMLTVMKFTDDLKAIFFGNSKLVAPFYLSKIQELEDEMSMVKPAQFDRLAQSAEIRECQDEPESVRLARQLVIERKKGIFRCYRCREIVDLESSAVLWNRQAGSYEHILDCGKVIDGTITISGEIETNK